MEILLLISFVLGIFLLASLIFRKRTSLDEIEKDIQVLRERITVVTSSSLPDREIKGALNGLALNGKKSYLKVAIMGCVVNGPGEARDADIGIAGGKGFGALFKKGRLIKKVREDKLIDTLIKEIRDEMA